MTAQKPDLALTAALKAEARRLGFSMVGVLDAAPARRLDAYLAWIDAAMHGTMGYMARPDRVARRQDPAIILPNVRSLVCVGLDYFSDPLPPSIAADPGRGRISNYAWQRDYHDLMTPRLAQLADWLRQAVGGAGVASRVYVDTGAILERDHAETAGLGFTGKNTMLIEPRRGSWFFLGELLTTLPLAPDAPQAQPGCGTCSRCLTACPTHAFPQPYVLDARRCISYLTIELKGAIPHALRPLLGNWIYGCDICQDVCPFNRFARPTAEPAFAAATWDAAAPPLPRLLALDAETFQQRFAGSPILRIGRDRLLRNACVAAGNWGHPAVVDPLAPLLADTSALVRGHAAWALGAVGGPHARRLLETRAHREPEGTVRAEINAALAAM